MCAVDVRAIILLGTSNEVFGTTESPIATNQDNDAEQLMGYPIGAVDLLGQPVICHVIDRLRSYGISGITVLSEIESLPQLAVNGKLPERTQVIDVATEKMWARAEDEFLRLPSQTDSVLVIRVGPYAEVDFNQLLKFHIARRNAATAVWDKVGNPLDIIALDPSRKIEATAVLRRKLRWNWRPSEMFHSYGYVNLLQNGEDFRALAEDALMRRCALIPRGQEVSPGVWLGKSARVHPAASVEGPAFIGEHTRIGAGTVLAGCSTLEHHSQVDRSTRLDNSTVLPFSYVGKNLNVTESVIGFSQVSQVKRNVTVSIADAKLIRSISMSPVTRSLAPVHSIFSRVSKNLSETFGRKDVPEVSAIETFKVEAAEVVPQKAHAAAASGSVREKKRTEHN